MPRSKEALLFQRQDLLDRIANSDHLRKILLPERYIYPLFRPVEVNILMFTDASGGFDGREFGLSEILNVLAVAPGPWVRFNVTTAHRNNDASAMLKNFRFDAENLSQYDEIWMVAVQRLPSYLSDAELRAISEFMANGGGVFATGDHEDLGGGLCARIPRVRNMRMWYWPNPGPNGEPVAPKIDQANRHDTLTRRNGETIAFDHQSDDVPQEIMPVMYTRYIGFLRKASYPHPVLCGPNGVLKRMPDHPHEGHCYEPSDLNLSFTFNGATFEEYPTGAGGLRPTPEVIAHSGNAHRDPADVKGALNAKNFGSIGVYNGHQISIGRILVDSTWHHFFNINLTGRPGSSDPRAQQGFYGSAAGLDAYEDIKAYFRNIAVYLARKSQVSAMRTRALWFIRFDDRIAMDLRVEHLGKLSPSERLLEYVRIGIVARDVLGRYASRCQVLKWAFELVELPLAIQRYIPPLDPVAAAGAIKEGEPAPPAELIDTLEVALLGAAIYGAAADGPSFDDRAGLERIGDKGIAEIMQKSAAEAVNLTMNAFRQMSESGGGFVSQVERDLRL